MGKAESAKYRIETFNSAAIWWSEWCYQNIDCHPIKAIVIKIIIVIKTLQLLIT